MNKRGAYFFVIDALIGASIIFLGLIIILTTHVSKAEPDAALKNLNDYVSFITSTKIRSFSGSYVQQLINDKNITELDNTLVEQLLQFYYDNMTGKKDTTLIMKNYIQETIKTAIPEYRSISVLINETTLYESETIKREEARIGLSAKKPVFKRINDTYIYGPLLLEVRVWV